jgi:histone-lysine N-methyltransferase SETMAR
MTNEIHSKFINVFGDSSLSFSTIKKWAAEFKRGRTSLEDDPREGRPKSATSSKIIEQVHDMVLDDWWMKVLEFAETTGISKERVGYIFHEELDMKKLCARWVPRLLTADQKCTCMNISVQCLQHFNKNKTDFVHHRFITVDETWIHHYTPESKQQSKAGRSRLFSAKEENVSSISRIVHGTGVLGC